MIKWPHFDCWGGSKWVVNQAHRLLCSTYPVYPPVTHGKPLSPTLTCDWLRELNPWPSDLWPLQRLIQSIWETPDCDQSWPFFPCSHEHSHSHTHTCRCYSVGGTVIDSTLHISVCVCVCVSLIALCHAWCSLTLVLTFLLCRTFLPELNRSD